MCGFCGIYASGAADSQRARVAVMSATLAHRGPDATGTYVGDGVVLGHRRLSILDLSPAGAQPMSLGPQRPAISHNGEVYNFAELRRELEAQGRAFRGHSDTEVMLHAYDAWGLDGLKRLEGIFAFALWDPVRKRLVLMRDRLGIKPLFYAHTAAGLAFGSEIKAVLAAGAVDTALDEQAFAEYLWYGNAYEDRTIYRGVRSLQPGHWLIAEDGRTRIETWWKLEDWARRPPSAADPHEAATQVRAALDQAVARQLVADVPVGILLSGGVDSSSIAAAAMKVQSKPLASYSVGFDFERGVNELPKARKVAEHLGLEHHELRVSGTDLTEVLLALARAHDEPFADAANIPLYMLARALGGATKVVLQGDGGDEMFAGYRRYSVLRHTSWWKLWPRALTPAVRAAGGIGVRTARMLDAVGAADPGDRMALLLTMETRADSPFGLLRSHARAHLESTTDPFLAYRRSAARFADADPVQQMLLTDICVQLPSQFLPKVDRATMAVGVEARVPLLDERIVELAAGMPSAWKARGAQTKIVLRDAMRERLPAAILDGPKTGFGVPYGHWLRGPLRELTRDCLLAPAFVDRFQLERGQVETTLREHDSGRERGFILWKLLQLALWSRECRQ
jgi:asparagine synthase (glutamine-hydrolysing)